MHKKKQPKWIEIESNKKFQRNERKKLLWLKWQTWKKSSLALQRKLLVVLNGIALAYRIVCYRLSCIWLYFQNWNWDDWTVTICQTTFYTAYTHFKIPFNEHLLAIKSAVWIHVFLQIFEEKIPFKHDVKRIKRTKRSLSSKDSASSKLFHLEKIQLM